MRITLLLFLLLPTGLFAQNAITVSTSVARPEGTLVVALCGCRDSYERDQGCSLQRVKVRDTTVEALFDIVPDGEYAVKVFHDLNDNGRMDTNLFGIPKEPYGFSNNAMGTLGPPSFEEAKFLVRGGAGSAGSPKKVWLKLRG